VRHLRREALLVAKTVAEARQQRVERRGETRELVVGLAACVPAFRIVLAPIGCMTTAKSTAARAIDPISAVRAVSR
jgi:hypothetical protein